jgi:5-methylcytosine-specific restriction endonuclease McrA
MSNIANKLICLQLNAGWKPTGMKTVREAIIQLCGSSAQDKPTDMALDIEYPLDAEGHPIFTAPSRITPIDWYEWIKLPIREWDMVISSPNKEFRAPTVIVSVNHKKMPMKMFRGMPNREDVRFRDKNICQYSGRKLTKESATIDHIIPKSRWEELGKRGSPDNWENVVLCSRDINEKKGNRLNNELGLKLLKNPIKPGPVPVSSLIQEAKHRDWQTFIES